MNYALLAIDYFTQLLEVDKRVDNVADRSLVRLREYLDEGLIDQRDYETARTIVISITSQMR